MTRAHRWSLMAFMAVTALCGALAGTTGSTSAVSSLAATPAASAPFMVSTAPSHTGVLCLNRITNVTFIPEYSNLASPTTQSLSSDVKEFLSGSFTMSDSSALQNSAIEIVAYRNSSGSVEVSYVLHLPATAWHVSLEYVRFYINFGIVIYQSSGSRKLKMDANTIVQELSGFTPLSTAITTDGAISTGTETPMPEATTPMSEATTPMSEATTPMPEATTPMPEATAKLSEATTPMSEATTPMSETTTPMSKTTTPMSEATTPMPEATTPMSEATTPTSVASPSTSPAATAVTKAGTTASLTSSTSSSTTTSVATTAVAACVPADCRFGGRCMNGACRCRPFRGGSRCEKKRTKVNCRNRMPRETFQSAYRDLRSPITIAFWQVVINFLLSSFRLSNSVSFREADFELELIGFETGSVVALYTLRFDLPDSAASMSVEAIKAAMDSGISAYSSTGGSNLTMEANSSVAAHNYCADSPSPCSQFANCSQTASTSTYACACWSGFRDEDTSAPGTTCTQLCTSATAYCSGNGICRSNTDARVSCECFNGYSGDTCELAAISQALLAIAIVVPILFVIIVVLIGLVVWVHRRQARVKRSMYHMGGGGGAEDAANDWQSSLWSPRLKFPRANLAVEHPELHQPAEAAASSASAAGLDESAPKVEGWTYPRTAELLRYQRQE